METGVLTTHSQSDIGRRTMAQPIIPRLSFRTAPSPQGIPSRPEDERRITRLLRDSFGAAPGSWDVTLTFSGVLSHTWLVECQRVDDGRRLRMLVDTRRPGDRAALKAALASVGARPGEEETCHPPAAE
jgi:hypothetical protein